MWVNEADWQEAEAGDIAFYAGDPQKPIDALVMRRTNSGLVHVAVFANPTKTIAATSLGVTYQNPGNMAHLWRPKAGYDPARRNTALNWLNEQVGQPYGWADIANQLLLLASKDPVLLDKSEDCSDLATKFLWIAGVALPAELIHTNRVTPGSLATRLDFL